MVLENARSVTQGHSWYLEFELYGIKLEDENIYIGGHNNNSFLVFLSRLRKGKGKERVRQKLSKLIFLFPNNFFEMQKYIF